MMTMTKLPHAERQAALKEALSSIEKKFGGGSIMRLGDDFYRQDVQVISTGSPALNAALGIQGLPRGRVIEIYGPESSGKTTLALKVLVECQKAGGTVAFIDAEHALNPHYVTSIGGNLDEILISQPSSGEEALQIVDVLTRSGSVDLIIIDSVSALTPQTEMNSDMGSHSVGAQARLMSHALRKLTANVQKTNTMLIFINQLRMKIGINALYGNPEITSGGNALKFYASVRIDIRKAATLKNPQDAIIGHTIKAKIVKNKMAAPFRIAEFDLYYDGSTNYNQEIFTVALEKEIIQRRGNSYSYQQKMLGVGKDKAMAYLTNHPDLISQIIVDINTRDKTSESTIVVSS
jgi:recombination protein RecA